MPLTLLSTKTTSPSRPSGGVGKPKARVLARISLTTGLSTRSEARIGIAQVGVKLVDVVLDAVLAELLDQPVNRLVLALFARDTLDAGQVRRRLPQLLSADVFE